jgi:hypothetical protein
MAVAMMMGGACSSPGGGWQPGMTKCAGCKADVPAEKCCPKDPLCEKCDKSTTQ